MSYNKQFKNKKITCKKYWKPKFKKETDLLDGMQKIKLFN